MATTITHVAAAHGDAKLFDALAAAAERATSPEDHYRYLNALSEFSDPALTDRALKMSLSPDMRSQDTAVFLAQFLGNPSVNARAWAFVKQNWAALAPKITIFGGDTNVVGGARIVLRRRVARRRRGLFRRAQAAERGARRFSRPSRRINNCIALKQQQQPALAAWLERAR